jgi:hypothetical protein
MARHETLAKTIGSSAVRTACRLGIDGKRHTRVRVTEAVLRGLEVHAFGNHLSRVRAPQVMEREVREFGAAQAGSHARRRKWL